MCGEYTGRLRSTGYSCSERDAKGGRGAGMGRPAGRFAALHGAHSGAYNRGFTRSLANDDADEAEGAGRAVRRGKAASLTPGRRLLLIHGDMA